MTTFKYALKGHVAENNLKVETWLVHVFSDEANAKSVARMLKGHLLDIDYPEVAAHDPDFHKHLDGDPVNGLCRIFWDVERVEWSDTCDGVMGHGTGERKGMQI